MAELILHHCPSSPFSAQIGLVLDSKRLAWKFVIVPATRPKPDVVALTGRYGKTLFLRSWRPRPGIFPVWATY